MRSPRDDFLEGVLQDALAQKDVEVTKYAASKMALPVNRAAAAHRLARADRASASGLTSDLRPKELRVTVALGVYGEPPR